MTLHWREHDLFYGDFYIGNVLPWKHGTFKKNKYKITIMTSAHGESLGLVENEEEGRIKLETHASSILLKLP